MLRSAIAIIVANVALCGTARAQSASLVADVRTLGSGNNPGMSSSPRRGALTSGAFLYFVAFDIAHGWELWRTDGTPAGTRLAMDTYPGSVSGCDPLNGGVQMRDPLFRGPQDSIMFFVRTETGSALWTARSDGSVSQVFPNSPIDAQITFTSDTQPIHSAVLGNSVYFAANAIVDGLNLGQVLWASDGTAAGTRVVFDPPGGTVNVIGEIAAFNNRLYFACNPSNDRGTELWSSDGTSGGTSQLIDINTSPGASSSPHAFVTFGGNLYFFATPSGTSASRFFRSDGTATGTVQVSATISANALNEQPVVTSDGVHFLGLGGQLYRSDGISVTTVGGSVNINATTHQTAVLDDRVYFITFSRICRVEHDGSSINVGPGGSFNTSGDLFPVPASGSAPSRLYLVAGTSTTSFEPFVTDAALSAVTLLRDINPGTMSSATRFIGAINGRAVLSATDASFPNGAGDEPWVTDGTPAGTVLLRDIFGPTIDSAPSDLFEYNGHLYFDAITDAAGNERQRLDPPDSVVMCDETAAGSASLSRDLPTVAGGKVFSRVTGNLVVSIYAADSAEAVGTLIASQSGTTTYNGMLFGDGPLCYFQMRHPNASAPEYAVPWRSDGTPDGTFPLTDLTVGNPSVVYAWTKYLGEVYFLAKAFTGSTDNFYNLYATSGTPESTRAIAGAGGGSPTTSTLRMLTANGKLFYNAFSAGAQTQLWVYDGDGSPVRRVRTSASSLGAQLYSLNPVVYNDRIVWCTDMDQTNDAELWITDGSFPGTVRIKDIVPGTKGSIPMNMTVGPSVFGPRVYFSANDVVHGRELWMTDGTDAGTRLVKDIFPGLPGSMPQSFVAMGDRMYFIASDGTHGLEWWVTDGTEAGTRLVADIYPGPSSSSAQSAFVSGGKLYFSADDGVHGRELWAISPPCTADFNSDNAVDFFDYLDFVSAFASGDPAADFNADSIVDFFDYLDFVQAFSAGC